MTKRREKDQSPASLPEPMDLAPIAFLKRIALTFLTLLSFAMPATAQSDDPLVFATVHRPPFADTEGDQITGFSIDLMRAIADELGRDVVFEPNSRFGNMLNAVERGRVDGAIANISITADRERAMDFSQPIFGSGIQILLPKDAALSDQFLSFIGGDALIYVIGAIILVALGWLLMLLPAVAQSNAPLTMATVHRPPFAFADTPVLRRFSIDLMRAIGKDINREIIFEPQNSFSEMFTKVKNGDVDGAIANISITTEREREMDFSQPIFSSGIKIMIPNEGSSASIFAALFTWDIAFVVLSGLAILFFGGLLMWVFERRVQPYFDKPAREALFPSFWWALNLVVNGGFEERVPRSTLGRIFAVLLVVSSLFVVSIFVASITAAMTVNALTSNVQGLRDLENRRVATVTGSTSAAFLNANGLVFADFASPDEMFEAFEAGVANAVVFDGPILAYYQQTFAQGKARILERTYRPENYGIVLSSSSELKEEIDQILLKFRVDGTYDDLLNKWFGNIYTPQ